MIHNFRICFICWEELFIIFWAVKLYTNSVSFPILDIYLITMLFLSTAVSRISLIISYFMHSTHHTVLLKFYMFVYV